MITGQSLTGIHMSNKRKGFAAEAYYLSSKRLFQYAGTRFFASMGLFDCIFIDKDYVTRLVQVKKTTKPGREPRISKAEIIDIQIYVDQCCLKGIQNIWVGYSLIPWRKPAIEYKLN